jgi:hypothetical protein
MSAFLVCLIVAFMGVESSAVVEQLGNYACCLGVEDHAGSKQNSDRAPLLGAESNSIAGHQGDYRCYMLYGTLLSNSKATDFYVLTIYASTTHAVLDSDEFDYRPNGTPYEIVWCDYSSVDVRVLAYDSSYHVVGADAAENLSVLPELEYDFYCE